VTLVPRKWNFPTVRATVVVVGLLLAWLASGIFYLDFGNGATFDVHIATGKLRMRWGCEPPIWDKWYCSDGLEYGISGGYYLSLGHLPYLTLHHNPSEGKGEMPLWLVCPPLATLVLLLSCYRRIRPSSGHCVSCGYSLVGNTSGRCPECGYVTKE
jgi:hypothetical protein